VVLPAERTVLLPWPAGTIERYGVTFVVPSEGAAAGVVGDAEASAGTYTHTSSVSMART
jgi:hypothetical protein